MKEKEFILDLTCIEFFSMKALKIIFVIVIGIIFSCESNTYEEISGDIENPTYTSKEIYDLFYKTATKVKNGSKHVRLINLKGAING